jgi:hypothetical protein
VLNICYFHMYSSAAKGKLMNQLRASFIQQGREHQSRRTSMISSHNLATTTEDCNHAMAREDITDEDLTCATVIC